MEEKAMKTLTARDIAKRLGIGYNKALGFIRESGLPYIKINNTYRVSEAIFIEWLNSPEIREVRV